MYLIVTSQANDSQRNAVQAIVKAHAGGWWHQLPDVWVVQGHDHIYWRDLIKPVLLLTNATVIVFRLPDEKKERMWAATGTDLTKWLFESYSEVPEQYKPTVPKAPPTLPGATKPL